MTKQALSQEDKAVLIFKMSQYKSLSQQIKRKKVHVVISIHNLKVSAN